MFVVANRLPVADGYEERFIDLFEERIEEIRSQPGLLKVDLLRPVDGGPYVIQARWQSREAFERWRGSEAFRAAHANLPTDMFAGPNRLEVYERTATVEPGHYQ